jgi:molecular chaperone DnaJ
VLAEVEITLVEAAEGAARAVPFPAVVDCATCHGSGAAPGTSPTTCAGCGGTGRLQSVSSSFLGQIVRTQACPRCGGLGEVVETPCPGATVRRLTEERAVEVEIPRASTTAAHPPGGRGHAGVLGALWGSHVLVHVQPDDRFVREATTSSPRSS